MILGLVILGALGWLFAEVTDEVLEPETPVVDELVLKALRANADGTDPIGPRWLERAVVNISALGSGPVVLVIVLISVGFLILGGRRRLALLIALCAGGTGVVMLALKELFDRGRPEIVQAMQAVPGQAFPSGHAMISAALYSTLGVLLARALGHRRLQLYTMAVAAALAFLIGATRVYMGVHYPTDVLAGWTVGLAWALLCGLVARALQLRGVVESPGAN